MAVTCPISGSPLAIVTRRAPSATRSTGRSARTMVPRDLGKARRRVARLIVADSAVNSASLSRTTVGLRARSPRANSARPGERSMNTGSSSQGCVFVRGGRIQRRLDRRSALGIEGAEIDQKRIGAGDEGADLLRRQRHRRHAPTASSTFAVNCWATVLVMQCTRGACARMRARTVVARSAKSTRRARSVCTLPQSFR